MPRLVTEKDKLFGRLTRCVQQSQVGLGVLECLVTTNGPQKFLIEQEVRNFDILLRFNEVLFVGYIKAELVIWPAGEG